MSLLLSVESALQRVLGTLVACDRPVIEVELLKALGCILARDVISSIAVPGDDNSAMDGYALRAADAHQQLPVSQRIPAGSIGAQLQPVTAARIFTGAAIPPGADAVVMQENCELIDGCININGSVTAGQHIRPRGQDISSGSIVLHAGRRLRPQDIGLLASVGTAQVSVYKPLTVAILSTGDELVDPASTGKDKELPAGQIYNSNRYTLAGLLSNLNIEVVDGGIIPDDPNATARALQSAADAADCVICSGGVSVGEEDHVKSQVEKLGTLGLWKLAIKPGKPLAFGCIGETPFFGLPGNPTSVFVTFCLVARPYLQKLQGLVEPGPLKLTALAKFNSGRPGGRQEYRRVTVQNAEGGLVASDYENQSSGVLSSVSHSNAFAVIAPGEVVTEGDQVEIILLDHLT
ncbi:MAG: molybdopterin molybdotransferase [Halioglobus sp.]